MGSVVKVFQREKYQETDCFKAGFSPGFPFSGIPGFPLPFRRKDLGECEAVVGKMKVDKEGR